MTTLTVASANLGNHRVLGITAEQQSNRLKAVVLNLGADVVAVQEALRGLTAPAGFELIKFPGGAAQNPILIRQSLNLRGSGCEWIHDGREGAYRSKWDTWVNVKGWGAIANWHVMSQIDLNGRPRDPQSVRFTLARQNILAMRIWADKQRGPVIVAGDTNVDLQDDNRERYAQFPAVQLALAGLDDAPFKFGTLGSRTVDRIFHSEHLIPTKVAVLPRSAAFDHDSPAVTLRKRLA